MDEYIKAVNNEFYLKKRLELIIDQINKKKEENKLSAVDTLALVDKEINLLLTNINKVDTYRMIDYVVSVKKQFVTEAKEEMAQNIANMIKKEPYDIPVKINNYFNELKEKGIDLDGSELLKIKKEGKIELEKKRLEEEKKYVYGITIYPNGEIIKKARSRFLPHPAPSRRETDSQQNDTQFPDDRYYPYHS